MSMALNRRLASAAVFAERYILSPVYLYFGWTEFNAIASIVRKDFPVLQSIWLEPFVVKERIFAEAARHALGLLLSLSTGMFLLLGRRASVPPQKLRDVFVPLAAAFFFLTFYTVPWFPEAVRKSLCPIAWQIPLIITGLLLGIIGQAVSIWGIFYLGRSFGIFVVVRKVVLKGPYQWVRHPMYFGYVCMMAGIVLVTSSVVYLVLVLIQIVLLVYRARLEEMRLSESSPEYREYRQRTGFIFPKFL